MDIIKYDFTDYGLNNYGVPESQRKQILLNQEILKKIQSLYNEMEQVNRPFCYECGMPERFNEIVKNTITEETKSDP